MVGMDRLNIDLPLRPGKLEPRASLPCCLRAVIEEVEGTLTTQRTDLEGLVGPRGWL
jgi:hypothetical protein